MTVHEQADKMQAQDSEAAAAGAEEIKRLRAELADCRDQLRAVRERGKHDLAQAHQELAAAREIQEELAEQVRLGPAPSLSSPAEASAGAAQRGARLRRIWRRLSASKSGRQLHRNVDMVRASGLFDTDWYVTEYPDVANSGVDPLEHYLRFGAWEGRDPSPTFRSDTYLRDHPELAATHTNPLVHFLRSRHGAASS
jgi:hypothetical protein